MALVARALPWLAVRLPPPRIICDRAGKSPYLSRYHLLGAPTMPDGSPPFDARGVRKPGAQTRGFGVYLHRFHRGDDELELHNHPWVWALSLVLTGGYFEERRLDDDRVVVRHVRAGHVNVIRATDFHRIELADEETWTLFVVGPKFQGWGFWNRSSGEFLPWRE